MNDSHDDADPFWEGGDRTPTGSIRRIGRDVTGQIARVVHDHHEKHRFDRGREHRTARAGDATPVYIQPYDYDLDEEYGSLGQPDPVGDAAWRNVDVWTTPEPDRRPRRAGWVGVDRRLMRVGVIAAAAVVLAPVLIAVASGDGDGGEGDIASPRQDQPAVVAPQGDPATSTIPITAAAVIPITAAADNPADDDLADNDTSLDGVSDKSTQTATAAASAEAAASEESTAAEAAADEAAAEPEPDCNGEYTVVEGDYWYRIAGEGDVDAWLAANDATLETPLYAGDALCVPEGATAPAPPTTAAATTEAPASTEAPTTEATTTEAPTVAEAPPTEATTTEPPAPTTEASTTTDPPTTTAAPVAPPPPPPTTAAPGIPTDPVAIIRYVWPDELEERALTIARRESGYVPTAYNGWCCYGLFQIYFTVNRSFLAGQGVTSADQLLDAYTNARVAYAMYQASGWRPWSSTDPGS